MTKGEWKNTSGFEKLPIHNYMDEVGQETIGVFLGSKAVTSKKDGQTYVLHTLEIDGVKKQIFGKGLLNWLLDPENEKVKIGQEVRIVYKGLENDKKKAGKGNRHQFELFTR